ncbi:MAG TPA: cytochrome c biogenesis protein CcdA [Anaeromyxobacteraceae bacterium]|nr:cytochrome c biogenesis protein CcdA [Anaeromyxobacteraceae bacterium]
MRILYRVSTALAGFALVLALPHLSVLGGAGAASDLGLSRELALGSSFAFAIAFAGGVLTSLTPCVYPLIPITVSLFGAGPSRGRGQALAASAFYVLGMAITYSALGASAALTGKAFGTAMQSPAVVALVAVLFLAMAASMWGAFELRLPPWLLTRLSSVGGASLAGALAMGLVAGLIAAPCTGPVLAAALAYVATKGSVAYGGSIMFTYALGIGLLFFAIGVFSVSLPKSGPWMETVKNVFGVALAAMAIERIAALFPATRAAYSARQEAALWAAGTAAIGILMGALSGDFRGPARRKLLKGAAVALVALASAYAVGAGEARARTEQAGIAWLVNRESDGLARARAQGKPVIIDFSADWCAACKELDRSAFSDPRVREEASRFVAIRMDNSTDKIADPRTSDIIDQAFAKYSILGEPTVVFIDAHGRELPAASRVTSVVSAQEMLRRLRAVDQICLPKEVACLARW